MRVKKARDNWGSRFAMIMAVAGSAVGLGNFLRFPAKAASCGGGAASGCETAGFACALEGSGAGFGGGGSVGEDSRSIPGRSSPSAVNSRRSDTLNSLSSSSLRFGM